MVGMFCQVSHKKYCSPHGDRKSDLRMSLSTPIAIEMDGEHVLLPCTMFSRFDLYPFENHMVVPWISSMYVCEGNLVRFFKSTLTSRMGYQ